LKGLNRHQKAADVYALLDSACGLFDNLSVDIIVGLPGVSEAAWKDMISQIVTWPINHVSLYFLTVHEDTQLYFGVRQNKIILPPDDLVVDLYYWTIETFARAGILQYEISNFAKEGWQSKHNSAYWQRVPYKGFGLGACSFDGVHRIQNEKNLLRYLEGIRNTNSMPFFMETVSESQAWLERIMLGLRQRKGVCIHDLLVSLTEKERDEFVSNADELSKNGLLEQDDGYLRITPAGLSVANEVMVKLSCIDMTEK
jgi:oxygen-independent coproporphyrinogen-3 oxidase